MGQIYARIGRGVQSAFFGQTGLAGHGEGRVEIVERVNWVKFVKTVKRLEELKKVGQICSDLLRSSGLD
jgi:hypothetical protein